ncbi:hypothetical protein QYF61_005487 [Mycteria americana]|uniref:Uncharacterized protein n=1 Tax=Mycteria americana TaxID=33587 RepID=A0AAN7MGZ8_MYCAM|nr:hypothetical protein QYF61_005487 [Mycteria americana]
MMIMASWVQPDLDCSPLLLELLKAVVLGVLVAALTAAQKYKCMVKWAKRDASESSQDSGKSLQAELQAEREKWVRSEIRLQNQLRDAFVREHELRSELAEARREDLVSECGRCGLFKEREMADRDGWEEMERAKCQHDERSAPQLRPLIKTEFQYEGCADTAPEIVTKEIPYSATELAKLQDRYSRLPRETETEYVWRVSLTGGDRIKLSEEDAQGYWGPGVFLTVPDTRAPWSLTQRAAYWAGGLDPVERGDPVSIPTPGPDQITESVQKTACLQLMHDRLLIPYQPSPMLLKADPNRMKPLIKGLPDPLKVYAIQIQDRQRAALPIQERLTEMLTPGRNQMQSTPAEFPLTWGGVAQELINYSRNVGISGGEQRGKTMVRRTELDNRPLNGLPPGRNLGSGMTRSQLWREGLHKEIPRELMNGLSLSNLQLLVQGWKDPDKTYRREEKTPAESNSPSAPPAEHQGTEAKLGNLFRRPY